MIIGGIAVIARGVRRMTTDIDAVVLGDAAPIRELLISLARVRIEPRIPDAESFARQNLVLLVRHVPSGVDLDLSLAWSAFEREALESRTEVAYGKVRAPMATAEDLVVLKAVAGRPVDIDDAEALLVLHSDIDVVRVIDRVQAFAELIDAPELLKSLADAIARARAARRDRPRPSATRPKKRRKR